LIDFDELEDDFDYLEETNPLRNDENCINDDSKVDNGGDTCSKYYDIFSATCGLYDTLDFKAARECCICGGGSTGNQVEQIQFDNFSAENLYRSVGALSTLATGYVKAV
jgi:hypothetical protein